MKAKKIGQWLAILGVISLSVALSLSSRDGDAPEGPDLVEWQPVVGSVEKARSNGKLLFYDFSAAWCPPCRRMEKRVFSDQSLAQSISNNFVPVHVIDRRREDGANPAEIEALQNRFGVDGFPTVIVADAEGRERARFVGYRSRDSVAKFVAEALSGR